MKINFALNILLFASLFFASCANSPAPLSSDEKKGELYYQHGTEKLLGKDYTQALDFLLKAHKLKPNDTKVENNLGMAYYFKKQIAKSKEHLVRAVTIDPKNSDARNNLASLYLETGEYELAESEYNKILEDLLYTTQFTTYYNLALVSLKRNKVPSAIDHLKKSLKENEDYCPSYYLLGGIYKKQYRYKDALDMFRRGTHGSCYNNPAPLYEQAMIQIEMNDLKRASEKLQEIIEKFPGTKYQVMASDKLKEFKEKTDNRQYKVMSDQKNFVTPTF